MLLRRHKITIPDLVAPRRYAVVVVLPLMALADHALAVDCGIDWTTTIELIGKPPIVKQNSTNRCVQVVSNSQGQVITSEGGGTKLKSVITVPGVGTTTWVYQCRTVDCPTPCVPTVDLTVDTHGVVTLGKLTCDCCRGGQARDCECIPVPTVSQWGLLVIALLLLTAGAVAVGRWRRATD